FEEQNGTYMPILRTIENNRALEWGLKAQHSAIVNYVTNLTNGLKDYEFDSNHFLLASEKVLKEFVNNPHFNEAEVFGSYIFAEDQTDNILYSLAPKYTLEDCLNLNFKGFHPHHNVWFSASYKRSDSWLRLLLNPKILQISWKIKSLAHKLNKFLISEVV
ncbi:MAG: hypothetical protein ACKPER_02665, partial [Dolichospermum sp.]